MSGGTLYIGTGNSTDASMYSTTLGGVGIINLNTGGAQTGATFTLTGGTIGATSAWASSLNMTLANTVTFQSENLITTANTPSGTAETITLSGALTDGTSAGTLAATGNGDAGPLRPEHLQRRHHDHWWNGLVHASRLPAGHRRG